jgi:acyl dehydratase
VSETQPATPSTSVVRPTSIADLQALVGQKLGPTEWHDITQERINAFADLTGDHQWIHVDPERANASAFGSTIAHGLYSLSIGPRFMEDLMAFDGFAHSLNYGYEKVRFPAPLPVNSRIRMHAEIVSVDDVGQGAAHIVTKQTFEREGSDKPICVAQSVGRFTEYPA